MSDRKPPQKRRQCGTVAGYRQHTKRKERHCQPCREANSEYQRQRRAKQKDKPKIRTRTQVVVADGGKKDGYPAFLRDAGRKMWDELHGQYAFDPASEVLLTEACRLKDRLERFAAALSSSKTLWFELGDVEETMDGERQVSVVINSMVSEARQTQAALGVALGKLGVLTPGEKKQGGPSMADELKRKRQERLAAAKEGA